MLALALLPRRLHDHHRQPHGERRALPFALTLGEHRAAVHLDDVTDDGEAKAKPAGLARRAGVALAETFEHERQEILADSDAGVADHDLHVRIDALDAQLHAAAL